MTFQDIQKSSGLFSGFKPESGSYNSEKLVSPTEEFRDDY
jgi:hypothetical protein